MHVQGFMKTTFFTDQFKESTHWDRFSKLCLDNLLFLIHFGINDMLLLSKRKKHPCMCDNRAFLLTFQYPSADQHRNENWIFFLCLNYSKAHCVICNSITQAHKLSWSLSADVHHVEIIPGNDPPPPTVLKMPVLPNLKVQRQSVQMNMHQCWISGQHRKSTERKKRKHALSGPHQESRSTSPFT